MMNKFRRMLMKTVAVVSVMISLVSGPAYAANISEMIASGADVYQAQPEEYKTKANDYFQRIPEGVIDAFKRRGGTINFTTNVLVGQKDVNGLYTFDSKRIDLKTTAKNNSWDEVQKAPVHEVGHFIYHNTLDKFTARMKSDIQKLFNTRKSFDPRCYNEDETFAALYSDYLKYNYANGANAMPSEEYRVFAEAEALCIGLV